jgi:hypothetical protein
MISAQMSGRQHQPKSEPMLDGEMLTNGPGVESPLFPCGLLRIPLFKGNLILSTIRWEQFLTSHPVQAQRVISTLLHNLGCKISRSSGVVRNCRPLDLKKLANRGFGNQEKIPGWFGDAKDDLRYFPANVTGNDPILNLPQPIEKFPESPLNYAGIDFEVINPETNRGRSCLVINAGGTVSIPVNAMGSSLWMLGALDKMKPDSTEVARISFVYSDRTSERVPVRAGVELNGYQGFVPVSQGVCAWTGPTPSRPDAVLWRWSVANPHPDKTISSITVEPVGEASIGLVGITVEEVRN